MFTITTGGKDVLDSKTFLTLDCGDTVVTLGEGAEALRFILEFIANDKKEQQLEWLPVDQKTLRVRLSNWNSPLGTTFTEPAEIGTFGHRRLYLMLNIKKAGGKGEYREVTMTAYLGEGVQDGAN